MEEINTVRQNRILKHMLWDGDTMKYVLFQEDPNGPILRVFVDSIWRDADASFRQEIDSACRPPELLSYVLHKYARTTMAKGRPLNPDDYK